MEHGIYIVLGIPIAWFLGTLLFQIGKLFGLWFIIKMKELRIWD